VPHGFSGEEKRKQVAFRVKTDAAILGAGIVVAGIAHVYAATPAPPCHHPPLREEATQGTAKLAASFSPWTRNATCGSPRFVGTKRFLIHPSCFSLHTFGMRGWQCGEEKALRRAQDRQIAFRVKTDAAILGAGGELTTKCAKRRERERQIFLAKAQRARSFTKKCNLRFASMAQRHGFHGARISNEIHPPGLRPVPSF
jgi:hypothetical protein